MSLDIFFQDWGNYKELRDIPESFKPKVIGTRAEITSKIKEVLPDVNFEDIEWGILEREGISIEFNMGKKKEMYSFALHIREYRGCETIILQLVDKLQIRASDGIRIIGEIQE